MKTRWGVSSQKREADKIKTQSMCPKAVQQNIILTRLLENISDTLDLTNRHDKAKPKCLYEDQNVAQGI